jgi:peptidoglycan/LPS O-acetylase OafA/YrhL
LAASVLGFWLVTQVALSYLLGQKSQAGEDALHDLVYYFPPSHLCSFAMGLAGGLIFQDKGWARSSGWLAFLISFVSGACVVYALDHQSDIEAWAGVPLAFASSFYAPLFLVLILGVASSRWGWSDWLAFRPLVLLGEASYSLYILQVPIYQLYTRFLAPRLPLDPIADFVAYVILLIGVSVASFLWFEKPLNRWLRGHAPAPWLRAKPSGA